MRASILNISKSALLPFYEFRGVSKMRVDEKLGLSEYLKLSFATPDGRLWIVVIIATMISLADLLSGYQILPLAYSKNMGKAISLLLFSPIISFFMIIFLRMIPFNENLIMSNVRGLMAVLVFIILNF
jgi:hypothetical protein